MARPRRLPIHGEYRQEFPGAIYHLTPQGNARQKIFFSDNDSQLFLDILAGVVNRYNYHLLVENPRPSLSLGMRQLNGILRSVEC
jgi:putative transposase